MNVHFLMQVRVKTLVKEDWHFVTKEKSYEFLRNLLSKFGPLSDELFKMTKLFTKIFLIAILINEYKVDAANILALIVTPSISHHIWNRALMLELAARGHNVTVVSPDPEKKRVPNHTDIIITGMYEDIHEKYDYVAMSQENSLQNYFTIFQWGTDTCKKGLKSEGANQLLGLVGKQTFDLIIVETIIDECFLGFVPLFGSPPLMATCAYSMPAWVGDITGSPNTASYINVGNLPYPKYLTFWQRTTNFIVHFITYMYRNYVHLPKHDKIAREFFGPHIPPIADIERNISIVLSNIHYSYDYPRPLAPTLIPVGGMHIKPAQPLPKDLQQYLDDSPNGVILFSLGSNVRSDNLDLERREAFLEAFAKLKQNVLWKWESETLPRQPKNVRISKWLPQNDILGHQNVRLFITHGGLHSTQEALYHGVPMVGIPFLADQYINLERSILRGVAERLDISTLTSTKIVEIINKVLENPSYTKKMKMMSAQFRDRPDTALNTAVWWTEYIIRHKGANHLRSAALDLPWYQYFLLDVLSFLIFISCIILFCMTMVLKRVKDMCLSSKKGVIKIKSK